MRRWMGWFLMVVVVGCQSSKAPTSQPVSAEERQENAMRDPMNWRPGMKRDKSSSSRDIGAFDKEGFNRDMDKVLNP